MVRRILVPIDFSVCSDAALKQALAIAADGGDDVEVEVLYVRPVRQRVRESAFFADTPQGIAMEQRLSAAECAHAARVSGRLEFGDEPSSVILEILDREGFDMVVMGIEGVGNRRNAANATSDETPPSGHVAANVAKLARCKVVTMPPPALTPEDTEELAS